MKALPMAVVELLQAPEFDWDQNNNDSPSDDNDDLELNLFPYSLDDKDF